ncbi:hypothetical protein EVAR_30039_1 [Eumeta japonica]|uniref:Uncharacterized protein n=1 Tax=Eumeta variegata TaxID=151549 RepID=A0A4C1VTC8_EUMVA|nr:hypothetical protein EVAR_30039_1 [Eumeta japonica]
MIHCWGVCRGNIAAALRVYSETYPGTQQSASPPVILRSVYHLRDNLPQFNFWMIASRVFNGSQIKPLCSCLGAHVEPSAPHAKIALASSIRSGLMEEALGKFQAQDRMSIPAFEPSIARSC